MKYSAYLFDLDGTLYDRDALLRRLLEKQYREFSAELDHIDSTDYVDHLIDLDAHGYHPKDQLYLEVARKWQLSAELRSRLLEHFWATYDSHCDLPDDTLTTIRALRDGGVRLGIVTNGQAVRQNAKIDALEIRDYFDAILISETEGLKKPASGIFERALARCGTSSTESVFIGDHPVADIDGSRGAGLAAVWKRVPYWTMTRPDVDVIDRLSELLT